MLKNVKEWQAKNQYSACHTHIKGISAMFIKGAISDYDEIYFYRKISGKVYGAYQGGLAENIYYAAIYNYDRPENILDQSALDYWEHMREKIETAWNNDKRNESREAISNATKINQNCFNDIKNKKSWDSLFDIFTMQ
jgi:hypothetical protein